MCIYFQITSVFLLLHWFTMSNSQLVSNQHALPSIQHAKLAETKLALFYKLCLASWTPCFKKIVNILQGQYFLWRLKAWKGSNSGKTESGQCLAVFLWVIITGSRLCSSVCLINCVTPSEINDIMQSVTENSNLIGSQIYAYSRSQAFSLDCTGCLCISIPKQ